jgi:dTDP-4-amino-4,6-dideoxygalactose transaminase
MATREKIDYRPVQTRHTKEVEDAVLRVIREDPTYTMGSEVKAFEKEFAEFTGAGAAVGVTSCSAALELSAVLCRVGPGDEVIVPAHSFVSCAVAFARRGAKIVWADMDPDTRLISVETIKPLLTAKTKVIVCVHMMGLTIDLDPILELAAKKKIKVVEDCAQAPGARYKGRRGGAIGNYGCFSFHTQKNITTLGEGGMFTCADANDAEIAKKLRWMGNWAYPESRPRYWVPAMGDLVQCGLPGEWPYNFCMSELNAAAGRVELKRLDKLNARRQVQAKRLKDGLADVKELSFQTVLPGCEHVYHMMPVRYNSPKPGKDRNDLIDLMFNQYDIKCYVHHMPLYRFPLFQEMGCGQSNCPVTDNYFDNMYGYPWWSDMTDDLLDRYIKSTREVCQKLRG